jgi:hypothetical protein
LTGYLTEAYGVLHTEAVQVLKSQDAN